MITDSSDEARSGRDGGEPASRHVAPHAVDSRGRPIVTERLQLIPATLPLTHAALQGADALAAELGAVVPASWPPEFLDEASLHFTLERLAAGPEQAGWWLHFVVLAPGEARAPDHTLVGSAGYAGPPTADGTVELGYGIVREHQRRGYASEAVRGLLAHAFDVAAVQRVIAHTLPTLAPSIGVLRACGFQHVGDVPAPGAQADSSHERADGAPQVIRFQLTRADHAPGVARVAARSSTRAPLVKGLLAASLEVLLRLGAGCAATAAWYGLGLLAMAHGLIVFGMCSDLGGVAWLLLHPACFLLGFWLSGKPVHRVLEALDRSRRHTNGDPS